MFCSELQTTSIPEVFIILRFYCSGKLDPFQGAKLNPLPYKALNSFSLRERDSKKSSAGPISETTSLLSTYKANKWLLVTVGRLFKYHNKK